MNKDMTLKEGIALFHKRNMKYFDERPQSQKGSDFLRCHDVAHVVFDCDTRLYGEGVVKVWTTFGTTLSFWQVTRGYNEVSAFQLFKKYSLGHIMKNILSFLIAIPTVIIRAKRMTKPWSFTGYEPYLNTPLSEIRKEYNIVTL